MKTTRVALIAGAVILACAAFVMTSRETPAAGRVSVPFVVSKSGHQVVSVVCRGVTLRLLLDTGSSGNILSERTASKLGLKTGKGDRLAAGLGAKTYNLSRVEESLVMSTSGSPFVLDNLDSLDLVFVEDMAGGETFDGLLGSPFFMEHKATIDFEKGRLVFDPKKV